MGFYLVIPNPNQQMKTTRITKTEESLAAYSIALDWLEFAEQVILNGETPIKLSDELDRRVVNQYEPCKNLEGKTFSAAANKRIGKMALSIARGKLFAGEYSVVLNHFRKTA